MQSINKVALNLAVLVEKLHFDQNWPYRQALQLDSKLTAARFNLCLIYLRLQMFGPLIGEYLTLRHQDPALAMQLEPLIVSK